MSSKRTKLKNAKLLKPCTMSLRTQSETHKVLSYLNLAPLPFETQNETRQSPIWKIAPVGRLNAPEREGPLFLSAV